MGACCSFLQPSAHLANDESSGGKEPDGKRGGEPTANTPAAPSPAVLVAARDEVSEGTRSATTELEPASDGNSARTDGDELRVHAIQLEEAGDVSLAGGATQPTAKSVQTISETGVRPQTGHLSTGYLPHDSCDCTKGGCLTKKNTCKCRDAGRRCTVHCGCHSQRSCGECHWNNNQFATAAVAKVAQAKLDAQVQKNAAVAQAWEAKAAAARAELDEVIRKNMGAVKAWEEKTAARAAKAAKLAALIRGTPLFCDLVFEESGSVEDVNDFISQDAEGDAAGSTLLHVAATAGDTELVQNLLELGADPTVPSKNDAAIPIDVAAAPCAAVIRSAMVAAAPTRSMSDSSKLKTRGAPKKLASCCNCTSGCRTKHCGCQRRGEVCTDTCGCKIRWMQGDVKCFNRGADPAFPAERVNGKQKYYRYVKGHGRHPGLLHSTLVDIVRDQSKAAAAFKRFKESAKGVNAAYDLRITRQRAERSTGGDTAALQIEHTWECQLLAHSIEQTEAFHDRLGNLNLTARSLAGQPSVVVNWLTPVVELHNGGGDCFNLREMDGVLNLKKRDACIALLRDERETEGNFESRDTFRNRLCTRFEAVTDKDVAYGMASRVLSEVDHAARSFNKHLHDLVSPRGRSYEQKAVEAAGLLGETIEALAARMAGEA